MTVLPNGLETMDYGTPGWSAIHDDNMETLDNKLAGNLNATTDFGDDAVTDVTATQADPDAQSSAALTDNSGGSVNQIINAVSGSGDDININHNFASMADDLNKVITEVGNLITVLTGTLDLSDEIKTQLNDLLAKLRVTGGCGVLSD